MAPSARAPRRRQALNKDRVLRAAMRLADAGGADSITMRKLGQALGVEAMSLYNHVAGRDEILDGITDLVVREIELPRPGEDWERGLRRTATSAHELLRRHTWACMLIMSPARDLPSRIRYMESVLRTFRNAGFSARTAYHAYHALDGHILGFTLWEIGHTTEGEDLAGLAAAFVRDHGDQYPYLVEHAEQHLAKHGGDGDSDFDFGLDLIFDGLKRMRRRSRPRG